MRLPKLSLIHWILLGFFLGILVGQFFGDLCSILAPISDAFIKIWQITILPSVVISLIVGIGNLDREDAGNIATKGALVLVIFWAIGIGMFFTLQLAFPNLEKAFFFSTQDLVGIDDFSIIDMFIPSNPFRALSEGLVPAIVIFCLSLGFALMVDKESKPILNSLNIFLAALTRITGALAKTFPIGVFVITAETTGTMTFEMLLELQVFLISLAASAILLSLVVLPLLVSCFTTFRYRDILFASSKPVLLGFSTGSEFITLPLIIEAVRKLFEEGDRNRIENGLEGGCKRSSDNEHINSYCEVLVPVAYTFPLLGALVPFLFILFVAWLYESPLDLSEQIKLIVVGIPSFFGSSKLSVETLLNLMHLPADAYNLYISTGIVRQCFVATLTCMSIFSFTTITIALLTNKCQLRWKRLISSVLFTLLLAFLMLGGLNVGFSHLLANTYQGSDLITNIELPLDSDGKRLDELVSTKVYLRSQDVPVPALQHSQFSDQWDDVKQIKNRGVLRVGYNSNCIPFVFFNGKGELVGYDVQMAYDLAGFINVSRIDFIPVTGDTIVDSLNRDVCDIVMSSVIVTSERLDEMTFTDTYMSVHMAFVIPDERKTEFLMLENVRKMNNLKIAVFNNTALVKVAPNLFPQAKIVLIDSFEDFFVEGKADALFTTAEEGYTMTLLYPFFDVAIFEPNDSFQIMYAYPVAKNSSDTFLMLLNYWLKMEVDSGKLDTKYDYWILGKDAEEAEPRWSVVRNVLHWVN
ncbi:MAG: cation:dicarboxylate symporter family transporter [Methanothrix sp.]